MNGDKTGKVEIDMRLLESWYNILNKTEIKIEKALGLMLIKQDIERIFKENIDNGGDKQT